MSPVTEASTEKQGPASRGSDPRRFARSAPLVSGEELGVLAVLIAAWIGMSIATNTFLTSNTISNLLFSVAPVAVIGLGMTVVIATAGIDVSVGSGLGVVTVIIAKLLVGPEIPAILALVIAIAAGIALGAFNGVLIAYGRVHPIIITFGTLNLFAFLSLLIFDNSTVSGIPASLAFLGGGSAGRTLGIPHAFIITILLAAILWYFMRNARSGRHFYAIGNDADAAGLAGIAVRRRVFSAYVLTGALLGFAACFLVGTGGNLNQNVGIGVELQVIAAVVIGGTSITGGRGSVVGTLLGALLVQTITTSVTLLGLPSTLALLFVGLFVLLAVGADLLRKRNRRAS